MRGRFTTPVRTSRCYTTAQVRDALRMRGVGRHEVACSAVSGKFLAWRGPVRPRRPLRQSRPLRQGQPTALCLRLCRQPPAEGGRHPGHPTGEDLILSASFDKQGEDPPGVATGILSLYHGDDKIGEAHIKTQPGKLSSAGKGCASAATAARPSPTTTRASRPGPSPAAPSSGSPSMSAASPTWT
jgi:hypothetical protein